MRSTPLLKFLKRAILVMAPFVFIACEKSNQELGLDQVIGEQAGLADTTLDVKSYTQNLDSILVALTYDDQLILGGYSGNRMVGSYLDGQFGRSYSSIVGQMILNTVNINFGNNPVVDSVNLYMRYTGSYGDTSRPMSFEVHQLGKVLSRDSLFYSDYEPPLGQKLSLPNTVRPEPNSFASIGGQLTDPTIRIPLDATFFQQNFADVGDGSFPAFSGNENFLEYFKGIYVSTTSLDGSILYFNLNSANSMIRLYYHNDNQDSLQFDLTFDQGGNVKPIHFSVFDHDYQGYPTDFDLSNIDSTNGEEKTYVQSMGGVITVLEIPGLENLVQEEVLINRAVLEIKKASGTGAPGAPPPRLEIRSFDNTPGSLIRDFAGGSTEGDGVFRSQELHQGYYRFALTRHIFNVANGGENQKLAVLPFIKSTAANRVILDGGQLPNSALKLKIYYTKP